MTAHPNPHVPKACEPIHYTSREFLTCRRELRDILIAPLMNQSVKESAITFLLQNFATQ